MGRAIINKISKDYTVWFTYNTLRDNLLDGNRLQLDIRDVASISNTFKEVGELDLIVTASFPYINTSLDSLDDYQMMEPYLRGHVAIFTHASQYLKAGGLLINLLGQSADYGLPSAPHYGASFAYLDNLSKSYNARYGRNGKMKVVNLQLGPVETSLWSGVSAEERKYFENKVQAFIDPEQVATMVSQLAEMKVVPTKVVIDGFFSLPE